MKTILYLVRHGETVDNARQLMQGQTQGELNDVGIGQARALSGRLDGVAIDAIVSSDLRRAVDTAAILAAPRGLSVVTTPLLRERDWGSFTGRFIPSLKGEVWPDDIETLEALLARARRFLDYVRTRYEGKTVLAVGHGIVNKAIQAVYYGKQMSEVERMANCDVRQLEL
jgi:probable phosphoglycerate mutase